MRMTNSATPALEGIMNLFKPVGASSAQYVYRLRPILSVRKIGHAGTLDPRADGVLLACVGRATKLVERLMTLPKHYRTTLRLGVTNRCFDSEQPFEPVAGAVPLDEQLVLDAVAAFVGIIDQSPPEFSAVRVGGVSSYKLAQRGRPAARAARPVRIEKIDVLEYAWPTLRLDIVCGRGTYIRAIARDLGARLGCGACCETLTRLAVGPFSVETAINLLTTDRGDILSALIPTSRVIEMINA
jgi:tRNA pseudouridine55 synthase